MKPVRWLGAIVASLLVCSVGAPVASAFLIGRNSWYLTAGHSVRGVLKVRHGVIGEVGIGDARLVRARREARRLVTSFR